MCGRLSAEGSKNIVSRFVRFVCCFTATVAKRLAHMHRTMFPYGIILRFCLIAPCMVVWPSVVLQTYSEEPGIHSGI